jgi:hypothetical protein
MRHLFGLMHGVCTDADCTAVDPVNNQAKEADWNDQARLYAADREDELSAPANESILADIEETQPSDSIHSKEGFASSVEEQMEPIAVAIETAQTFEKQAETLPSDELASLKHRWNFASLDCAAVVHRTNPSAKFASSILSEKKDRYMLSPCPSAQGEPQFVIIELCDEIKIDTLVLANFEFFSRMFKRFKVHVSRNLNGGDDEWLDIGSFRARNVRGLQVFKTPEPAGDARFFRYIRIDFLEHYGSEYYCPLSLVRVYGLTQMDDYIREEEELRKARDAENAELKLAIEGESAVLFTSSTTGDPSPTTAASSDSEESSLATTRGERPTEHLVDATPSAAKVQTGIEMSSALSNSHHIPSTGLPSSSVSILASRGDTSSSTTTVSPATGSPNTHRMSESIASSHTSAPVQSTANITQTAPVRQAPSNTSTMARPASVNNGTASASNHTHGGSESIYRTITKRLNMLEVNATQQRQMLTDMFTRLERDQGDRIGQLLSQLNESNWRQVETLKRKQQVDLQQALFEFDLHRQQSDVERRALMAQIHLLSTEIMLEKRFGIAQLMLLLGLFVFMALTRGSRASPWANLGVSRKTDRLARIPSFNRRSSPLSSSRPTTPSSGSWKIGRVPTTPKRNGSHGEEADFGDSTPRQNGRMRNLYGVDQLILPSLKRINGLHPGMHGGQVRGRTKRNTGRLEYSVRLPGGINAKVPARRRGGQLMLPAMSIALPARDIDHATEDGTVSPSSSSASLLNGDDAPL